MKKQFFFTALTIICLTIQTQKSKDQPATRQVGWVEKKHRYMRQSRQFAIRTPNPKRKGGFCYSVIVTTDMASLLSYRIMMTRNA